MKKKTFAYAILGLLFLAACKKFDWDGPLPPGAEKDYLLKKVIHGTRAYTFYFNKKKLLDSIGVEDVKEKAVFRIFRRENKVDSVAYLVNGFLRWYTFNVEYDNAGNPIRCLTEIFGPFPEPRVFTWQHGRLRSISYYPQYPPTSNMFDTLTYNQQNDITRWASSMQRSPDWDVKYFTYDNRYNPLYFVDDLLVIFSGGGLAREFYLSQHNSTSVFHELFNSTVNYQNYYDKKQRLIKKVFAGRFGSPVDSLLFQYQR